MSISTEGDSEYGLKRLGEILIEKGVVNSEQVQQARKIQEQDYNGRRPFLGEILVEQGFTTVAAVKGGLKEIIYFVLESDTASSREKGLALMALETVMRSPLSPDALTAIAKRSDELKRKFTKLNDSIKVLSKMRQSNLMNEQIEQNQKECSEIDESLANLERDMVRIQRILDEHV